MAYNFRNLVFEGGGVKGIAYGGALQALEARGDVDLSKIQRVAGTSAGAINAVLIALGYSVADVTRIIAETDFSQFADDNLGAIRDTKRLLNEYGWHKGKAFEKWIGKLIKARTGSSKTTFREFEAKASEAGSEYKLLYVVGTNLSEQEWEYYSHEHSPDMEIRKAVRISMSIPLYFQCVRNEDGDVLVDGGITRNYPIDIFDNAELDNEQNDGRDLGYPKDGQRFNHETLGFRLDDNGEKASSIMSGKSIPADIDNIYEYAVALIGYMRQMAIRMHVDKDDWNRTVVLDTTGVGVTEFKLSKEKIEFLIENGRAGVTKHFDWRTSDEGTQYPL